MSFMKGGRLCHLGMEDYVIKEKWKIVEDCVI